MESFNRWMYRGGRPSRLARVINSLGIRMYRQPSSPGMLNVLETTGRKSGNPVTMPVVVVRMENGRDYLVSMLGENVNWIRNVRAANGFAALLKGGRTPVRLVELPVKDRDLILKRYCEIAPAGRSHFPVSDDAPLAEFSAIAHQYPVFRVEVG